MTFGIESVVAPRDPDQCLLVYTVEPGSATAGLLAMLANWASLAVHLA